MSAADMRRCENKSLSITQPISLDFHAPDRFATKVLEKREFFSLNSQYLLRILSAPYKNTSMPFFKVYLHSNDEC